MINSQVENSMITEIETQNNQTLPKRPNQKKYQRSTQKELFAELEAMRSNALTKSSNYTDLSDDSTDKFNTLLNELDSLEAASKDKEEELNVMIENENARIKQIHKLKKKFKKFLKSNEE